MISTQIESLNLQNSELSKEIYARMAITLLMFHLVIFLVATTRTAFSATLHDTCWSLKFLVVAVGFCATWYLVPVGGAGGLSKYFP